MLFTSILLSACTLSSPFGTQCLSDQNCGCANCCISHRCAMLGPNVTNEDAGVDAGTPSWRVTTYLDVDAGLAAPTGLAIDSADNLYISDTNNNCIRKVTAAGVLSTVVCGLNGPSGLAVAPNGDLYIADTGNHCVKVVRAGSSTAAVFSGTCSTNAMACADFPTPMFGFPSGLALGGTTLLVTDLTHNGVRWVSTADGLGGTLAGKGPGTVGHSDGSCSFGTTCGSQSPVTFNGPFAITAADDTTFFIADSRNCALRKLTASPGCSVLTVGPRDCPSLIPEQNMSQLLYPTGVAVARDWASSGVVYATDRGNHRVAAIDGEGRLTNVAGNGAKGYADGVGLDAAFDDPDGIVVDSRGRLFVADSANHRIRMVVRAP
ncbi:MAG: hypothetical protein JNK82_09780 [Myxococcaceae bacterium]|nr:hypothetical protein [Myxococcaceae bacterium]